MKLIETTVKTTTEASELVADILSELGSNGIGIYDSNDFFELKKGEVLWDYQDDSLLVKSEITEVKGYFEPERIDAVTIQIQEKLQFLKDNSPFNLGSLSLSCAEVDDLDWIKVWKDNYKPIHVGRVTIVPDWIDYNSCNDEAIVRIDPGTAFGTGEHESTRMCLQLLQKCNATGKRVLDVGTGSGILGIAACKLGASKTNAYDIDDIAVEACNENIQLNGVQNIMTVENANLLDKTSGKFDIVLANITADPLIELSKTLKEYMTSGGAIIISGIILKRAKEVEYAYQNNGYIVVEQIVDGEWTAFQLTI